MRNKAWHKSAIFTRYEGRPVRWEDGVKRACLEREMGFEEAMGVCLDREK